MLFYFIRHRRTLKERPCSHKNITEQPQASPLKSRIKTALRKYEQRLTYHQKKMGLILFCIVSTCFFTWLLIKSLGRGHPFHTSVGRSIAAPIPPIIVDTHSIPQLWQKLKTYSDSIHHQSLQHDSTKDH